MGPLAFLMLKTHITPMKNDRRRLTGRLALILGLIGR